MLISSDIDARQSAAIRNHLVEAKGLVDDDSSFKMKKQFALINKKVAEYFGDYKEANTHLNTYFAYKDSIANDQKSQLIHNLEPCWPRYKLQREDQRLPSPHIDIL